MHERHFTTLLAFIVSFVTSIATAAEASDEQVVKAQVEHFLTSLGTGDYEALPAMFAPNATISHPTKVDDTWTMSNETFEDWFAARVASSPRRFFREPVNAFTVHLDGGLAFIRADASYYVDAQLRSNNLDYFTLIKMRGGWKFVNASYVSRPIAASQTGFNLAEARKLIEANNARFTAAHVAGDQATIDNMFTADAKCLPPGAEPVIGRDAIAALTKDYLKYGVFEFSEETTDFYGDGDLLIDQGNYVMVYGSNRTRETGKYLNVWKQEAGKWKIYSNIWNANAPAAPAN